MFLEVDGRQEGRVASSPDSTSGFLIEFLTEILIEILCAIPELFL
jgi:hypothetical protein